MSLLLQDPALEPVGDPLGLYTIILTFHFKHNSSTFLSQIPGIIFWQTGQHIVP